MITWKEYKRKPERFWKGRKVRTLLDISNHWFVIPKGYVLKITRKYQGFDLEGIETCPHCNIGKRIDISRVPPTELELVVDAEQEELCKSTAS